ncbi:MAG TPA: hypothetical protein VG942_16735 [Hyphomonadaceae bacterium]|nr:hypothetical protein [Hyphomonadaceae bacterium]
MSYDLMVFDPAGPPADRTGFLSWYSDIARWGDGRLASDPSATAPAVQAWYRDMIRSYPAVTGPDAAPGRIEERNAEYRFAPKAVFAAFQWEVARPVQLQAVKLARIHGVGLFEVSGDEGAVWAPDKGAFKLIHKNEEAA